MKRRMIATIYGWAWLLACPVLIGCGAASDEAEDKTAELVKKLGGNLIRDESAPGKPITEISFYMRKVEDAHLKEMGKLKNLQKLQIFSAPVTDAGLKHLASLPNLQVLELPCCDRITDQGLKELSHHKNLHTFESGSPLITDKALQELTQLTEIHTLKIGGTSISPAGLKQLVALKKLHTLNLNYNLMTDESFKALREVGLLHTISNASGKDGKRPKGPEEVTALNLHWPGYLGGWVTDKGLKETAPFKNLKSLDLSRASITDEGLKGLPDFPMLEELDLFDTKITPAGMKHLAPFKKLHTLTINVDKLTDECLRNLKEIGLLHALTRAKGIDGKRPKSAEEVFSLELPGDVTPAGLKELAPLKNLQLLELKFTPVTDDALRSLRQIGLLHALSLAKAKDGKRPKNSQEVTTFDLTLCPITDEGLKELVLFKNLESLTLESALVSKAGLKELQQALPKCKIVLRQPGAFP